MGVQGFTSETARRASEIGRKNKKLDLGWQQLGTKMTTGYARKIRTYMDTLFREGKEDEAIDLYLKLLQYFKPKVVAHAIKQQTEVIFKFEGEDKDTIEKI